MHQGNVGVRALVMAMGSNDSNKNYRQSAAPNGAAPKQTLRSSNMKTEAEAKKVSKGHAEAKKRNEQIEKFFINAQSTISSLELNLLSTQINSLTLRDKLKVIKKNAKVLPKALRQTVLKKVDRAIKLNKRDLHFVANALVNYWILNGRDFSRAKQRYHDQQVEKCLGLK